MKKAFSLTITLLIVMGTFFQTTSYANDFIGDYHERSLIYLAENNILLPDKDNSYSPNRAVTRGEFASYLSKILQLPSSEATSFSDVSTSHAFAKDIKNAAGAGIITGYGDGTFKPNNIISRQHMAVMILRTLNYLKIPTNETTLTFNDTNQILASYIPAVSTGASLGIIKGSTENSGVFFYPNKSATIGQSATFIFRLVEVAKENGLTNFPQFPPEIVYYEVNEIVNKEIIKGKKYRTYEEALKNVTKPSQIIERNGDILKTSSGIAYAADTAQNYAVIYSNTGLTKFQTYATEGREMKYLGSTLDYLIVQLGGTVGYAKHSEVNVTPTSMITGQDRYKKTNSGTLVHYVYNHLTKQTASYTVGPAPSFMNLTDDYFSYDGVHFYNKQGKLLLGTYYPYFQFQSIRQPSNYSAIELDSYINKVLAEKEASGTPRYTNATQQSKLVGLGSYLKEMEATYRVNAMFILATAIHESDYGISANALNKNNLFGIKVYDSSPELGEMYLDPQKSVFAFVTKNINLNYASPTADYSNGLVPGNKTTGINVRYASDPQWGSKVAGHMHRIDSALGGKDYMQATLAVSTANSTLNVRSTPEVTSTNKLYTYRQKDLGVNQAFGYPVVITETVSGNDGYTWYKVLTDTSISNYGWIRGDNLKIIKH